MSTSSAAVVSPKSLTSDIDDDEYEIEYEEIEEEIEVEEEVEVEEEIEEEVEIEAEHVESGAKDGIEEDLTTSRQENLKNDIGKILELDETKDHIQSSSLTEGVFLENIGDVKITKSSGKEELYVNGGKISKYNNEKTLLHDSGEVKHAKTAPFIGDVNPTSLMMANASGKNVNAAASIVAETNQSAVEGVGNISPRLHTAQIRFRDPLPSPEFGREIKKLRIVCEFHAKGWCIKGNSCRFLHIKDGPNAVVKKSEALGREASSSACIPLLQCEENLKPNSEMERLFFPKDDTYVGAPTLEDRGGLLEGGGSLRHNFYLDNYQYYSTPPLKGRLSARDSAYHGSSLVMSHDDDCDTRVSAFGPKMDEIICKESNVVKVDRRLADLPDSYSRHPLPFCSSSQNTSAHGLHKFLESSLEHHPYVSSSMQRSNPLASRSESDTLSRNRIFREAEPAKFEATSFDWEPSAPFSPSHEITRSMLLKECRYESNDKKDVKAVQAGFSHSDQGSSIKNVNVQSKSPREEEKLLNISSGDTVKDNILHSSNDDKVTHDQTLDETVLEADGSRTKKDIDADFKQGGHVQSESKAFKYFQSALIEFVKELVKPTWRHGFLTKDAHKLVVKKSVDKVLSALPTHQIPTTAESVNLYLSSSRPKLAKLVEGYIDIYGKT